jgi:CBS domain-containing protein
MRIQEILRHKGHDVVTIPQDRSALDAVMLLVEHNIGGVMVVDADRPIGILTERDILRLTARAAGRLDTVTVASAMTRDLVTATADIELHDAMGLMTRHKIRHLPVLDGERLAGMVSIGDLVDACRTAAEQENDHLREYIQGG